MKRVRSSRRIPFGADNFLSVLEGIEGGFAIFAGIVVGLYLQGIERELLVLTAGVGIIVSAFNSSAVRFTSEHYMDELDGHEKQRWSRAYLVPSLVEFISYVVVSFVAVAPLLFITNLSVAVAIMVELTLLILFAAGWYRGRVLVRRHAVRDGLETAGLGLLIVLVGSLAGWLLSRFVAS